MIKLRIFALFLLIMAGVRFLEESSAPKPPFVPPGPVPSTSSKMLMLYDPNAKTKLPDKGAMLDSPTFRSWLEGHHVDWRITPVGTVFNDDQPDFKKLNDQERKGDNWMYLDNGKLRGKLSQPLPENEEI